MTVDLDNKIVSSKSSNKDFGPTHWKYLFRLLGLVVTADKKVVPEEVETFISALRELAAVIDPKIVLTRHMIKDWLLLNKANLINDVDSLEYDGIVLGLLDKIKCLPHKLDIVTAMVNIAIADDNYSDMKKMFIKKTILYWNVDKDVIDQKISQTL